MIGNTNVPAESIVDCWIVPGGRDNGNILWVAALSGDMIVGGYPTLEAAQQTANQLGWDAWIEEV